MKDALYFVQLALESMLGVAGMSRMLGVRRLAMARVVGMPRMLGMEWHYALAARVYKAAGRRIINHSNPSRLDAIFERAEEVAGV